VKRLSETDLLHIVANKGTFTKAADLTGVPWQAIAAVWYRESFSVAPPRTPGGPFQFDPMPSVEVLEGLLHSFTHISMIDMREWLSKGVNDFQAGALFCACWLRHQSRYKLSENHTDEAVKDAFYGYNGRAWGPHPESSPYVYNEFDQTHSGMHIRGSVPDGHGGRHFIDNVDARPGAFTVYRQLIDANI
jgi:hypothetical protein